MGGSARAELHYLCCACSGCGYQFCEGMIRKNTMPYDDRGRWNDPLFTEEEYLEIIAEQEAERRACESAPAAPAAAAPGPMRLQADARSHGQSDSAHKRDRVEKQYAREGR